MYYNYQDRLINTNRVDSRTIDWEKMFGENNTDMYSYEYCTIEQCEMAGNVANMG